MPNTESIKTAKDKKDEEFRVYDVNTSPPRVVEHYRQMRLNHTVEFYERMESKYTFKDGQYRRLMTIPVSGAHESSRSRLPLHMTGGIR